jgi:hypothetical protein
MININAFWTTSPRNKDSILLTGESLTPPNTKLGVPFTVKLEFIEALNPAFTYACAF